MAGGRCCRIGGPWGPGRGSRRACARSGKRRMSPIAAMKVAAVMTLTPGTVISRRTCSGRRAPGGRSRARARRSRRRGSRCGAGRRRRSRARRRAARARPATRGRVMPNSVGDRRAALEVADQHRVDLVLGAGALRAPAACAARAGAASPASRSSGIHTRRSRPAASSWASVRASRRSVLACASADRAQLVSGWRRPPARHAARGSARSPARCRWPPARPDHRRQALREQLEASAGARRDSPR